MNAEHTPPTTIDDYIARFPADIQARLEAVRAAIRAAAPNAEEVISYAMPAFKQHGYLVFFAGFKKHIGMYGNTTAALEAYKDELSMYVGPKGSLKFPYNKAIPLDLITRIVTLRVQEDLAHGAAKARKRSAVP